MPREIKTTLMVDGEAAFKQSINAAQTSIRNMGTQLTLAAAQFKADGDAMKLMESRSKTLKAEVAQQENIVKALEQAVKESSQAYGENSEKTERWEAELNRARTRLVNLQSELTLNEQGLDRNGRAFDQGREAASRYGEELQNIGKNVSLETLSKGVEGVTGAIGSAIEKVIELGERVTSLMREAAQWADDLATKALQNNVSVEEQQRMEYASLFADVPVDTIMAARDRVIRKMVSGWKGEGDVDMWEFLGIDASTARDPMDVLFDLGEALKGVRFADRNDVRADAWAMEVFGRGYRELLPLFEMGQQGFRQKMDEAPIVSEENVEKLTQLQDRFDEFDAQLDKLKRTALAELSPALEKVVAIINGLLTKFNEWMETEEGKQAMAELSQAITDLFSGLENVDFKEAVEKVKGAINGIKDALVWISEHGQDVLTALGVIAGGFALLKVTELAANITRIVAGMNTLWSGASRPLPNLTGMYPASDGGQTGQTTGQTTGGQTTTGTPIVGPTGQQPTQQPTDGVDTGPVLGLFNYLTLFTLANQMYEATEGELRRQRERWDAEIERDTEGMTEQERDDYMSTRIFGATRAEMEAILAEDRAEKERQEREREQQREADRRAQLPGYGAGDEEWLAMLGDLQRRGTLHNLIANYGTADDSVAGWAPWSMMLRYWGEYRDESGRRVDNPLENYELEALVQYLRELDSRRTETQEGEDTGATGMDEISKLMTEAGVRMTESLAEMKINTELTRKSSDVIGGMDLRKFNGLPAEIVAAARSGTASGVSGIRVYLDGSAVGQLVAPYVDAAIGAAAEG